MASLPVGDTDMRDDMFVAATAGTGLGGADISGMIASPYSRGQTSTNNVLGTLSGPAPTLGQLNHCHGLQELRSFAGSVGLEIP